MTTPDIKKMTTPKEIIKFYNFKTEKTLKRLRENVERFRHKNIHMFTSLILYNENYEETLNPAEAINVLVIN